MTLLAEREGARSDLVAAAAHACALLIVTLAIPFAFQLAGLHGVDADAARAAHRALGRARAAGAGAAAGAG